MHPYIQYQMANDHIADIRGHAEHHRIVRSAWHARRDSQPRRSQLIPWRHAAPRAWPATGRLVHMGKAR